MLPLAAWRLLMQAADTYSVFLVLCMTTIPESRYSHAWHSIGRLHHTDQAAEGQGDGWHEVWQVIKM